MKKTCIIFFMILWLITWGCGGSGGDKEDSATTTDDTPPHTNADEPKRAKWTYMVYMGADNNLSTAGLIDLNEMEQAGSDRNINIVLQAEFNSSYTNFEAMGHTGYQNETLRYLVKNDGNAENVNWGAGQSIGNVDMGSPETLTAFIEWATTTYPAEKYALVIWSHGKGWKESRLLKGAVQDETSDSFMSLPDLSAAVRAAGVHLDIINFDACLMAMYEVAYEFNGTTDYMIFSEETEPGDGDPYDTILNTLKARPDMSGLELSETIVEKYHEFYNRPENRMDKITKSAVDMDYLPALHGAVLSFADAIIAEYGMISAAISHAQLNGQHFAYKGNMDLYDFSSRLANGLANTQTAAAALDVAQKVTEMVVCNRTLGESVSDAFGLAVYVPSLNLMSNDNLYNELQNYNRLACNQVKSTVWVDAVKTIVGEAQKILHPGGFSFYITWDTDADLDLYVLEPDNEAYAPWMGQTTPNGYFSADSYDTDASVEYYVSNDYVQSGDYDVFIEYYQNGENWLGTNVELWYFDPDTGGWNMSGPVFMNLENPYSGDFCDITALSDLNTYSNYWYTGNLSRAIPEEKSISINIGKRKISFNIRPKKRVPELNPEILRYDNSINPRQHDVSN